MKILENIALEYEIVQGNADIDITELVYDSRKVIKDCIFVCLRGLNFNSHDIIEDIVKAGAKAVVIEEDCIYPSGVTVIRVASSRKALALLSAAFFSYPAKQMTLIGITGTKGKTSTAYMIKTVLEKVGHTVGMIGTNGVFVGDERVPSVNTTPESFELHKFFQMMLEKGCTHIVMEVSSQGVKLDRTYGIEFDYGIFSNISPDHIGPGEHESFEEYLLYKMLFFKQVKKAILNLDDTHTDYIIKNAGITNYIGFGKDVSYDYSFQDVLYRADSYFVGIQYDMRHKKDSLHIQVGIPGYFNIYNSLSAVIVGKELLIGDDILSSALADMHIDGRMEIAYRGDFSIIVDYAHNAVSMESLLKTLREYQTQKLVVLFGCGGNRAKDRRYQMGSIAAQMADFSIITADNSRFEKVEDIMGDIVSVIRPTGADFIEIPDRREAIFYAVKNAKPGDMIAIIGKGHEDYQEIEGVRYHFKDREVVEEAIKKYYGI